MCTVRRCPGALGWHESCRLTRQRGSHGRGGRSTPACYERKGSNQRHGITCRSYEPRPRRWIGAMTLSAKTDCSASPIVRASIHPPLPATRTARRASAMLTRPSDAAASAAQRHWAEHLTMRHTIAHTPAVATTTPPDGQRAPRRCAERNIRSDATRAPVIAKDHFDDRLVCELRVSRQRAAHRLQPMLLHTRQR